MTFNPEIPQAADIIATSQGQLLVNDQQLNIVYGTSGDHYAWDNTTGGEQNLHAKVTLPGLPTANAPGNVLPTPGAGIGAAFSITTAAQTYPFWRRDTLTTDYPLLPVKIFGECTVPGAVLTANSFNITDVTRTGVGEYRFNFTETLPDTNYTVMCAMQMTGSGPIISYQTKLTTSVIIQLIRQDGAGFTDAAVTLISMMVLRN